ncbi:sporulation integral membrane protein YlbJ [Heliorestis convoluta]|uniref:Sporulation integral membrane protein YlbJ n=1 Tax=Heliorestis convoluta TaxID=356322 RepID=A0A5Q2N3D7_9FIRM|nr:sporulation integral membrane protein YlbJ [Heliorestis convoluta]QGG48106.1 Sporulation integral membrane protein YlbJ [Heliorestis convoluta]
MKKALPLLFLLFLFFLAPLMVYYPQESLIAARDGLHLWFTVALPALFPFLVVAELIMNLRLASLVGLFLEPLMRPLFRLPGPAGVVVAVGFTTGFPIGAIMTTRLIEQGLLTRSEGERLALFTNNASPLFLLGVVGTALLGQPEIGLLIACSHYGANFLLGIFYGFSARNSEISKPIIQGSLLSRIGLEWNRFLSDTKPPGEVIGQSVIKAMNNVIAIGGYLIFFTVVFRLFYASGILDSLIRLFETILQWFHFTPELAKGLLAGLMEMTIGCQQVVATDAPLLEKVLLLSFILAWSGLSIQAQVAAFLVQSAVPIHRYVKARLYQGFLSVFLSYLLFQFWPLSQATQETAPLLSNNLWPYWPGLIGLFYIALAIVLLLLAYGRRIVTRS